MHQRINSYRAISPKGKDGLNLKIPMLSSLENSPLSPLSYGELSTDRQRGSIRCSPEKTSFYNTKRQRLAAEIALLNHREILNRIWKAWRSFHMRKRISRFKAKIAEKNAFNRYARKAFFMLLSEAKFAMDQTRLARLTYARRLRIRVFRWL
jgi:hypothetical protein